MLRKQRALPEHVLRAAGAKGAELCQARARGPRRGEHEEALQEAVSTWWELEFPWAWEWTCHPANGGARTPREAGVFARTGVKSGVPDLLCFLPSGGFQGLALELKTPGNRAGLTPRTEEWLARLHVAGWRIAEAYSLEEAQEVVRAYLA